MIKGSTFHLIFFIIVIIWIWLIWLGEGRPIHIYSFPLLLTIGWSSFLISHLVVATRAFHKKRKTKQ